MQSPSIEDSTNLHTTEQSQQSPTLEECTNLHSNNSEKSPPLEESTNLDSNAPPVQLAPWDGEKAKDPEYLPGTFSGMF